MALPQDLAAAATAIRALNAAAGLAHADPQAEAAARAILQALAPYRYREMPPAHRADEAWPDIDRVHLACALEALERGGMPGAYARCTADEREDMVVAVIRAVRTKRADTPHTPDADAREEMVLLEFGGAWLTPEGALVVCEMYEHFDALRRRGGFEAVLARWQELNERLAAERLDFTEAHAGSADGHIPWHDFDHSASGDRDALRQAILDQAYAIGWVRCALWEDGGVRKIEAEGLRRWLAHHRKRLDGLADACDALIGEHAVDRETAMRRGAPAGRC